MGYAEDWQTAKEKFENDTGLKKPAAKGKFLFVSWRKPSGIEDALKDIDKVAVTKKEDLDEKVFKKWEDLIATLTKKQTAYLKTLDDSIKNEKDESGKSDLYRHMKILKASLDAIVARAGQGYKDKLTYRELEKAKGDKALESVDIRLQQLKMLGTNLKSGIAVSTKFCQEVLGNPTPANWNRVDSDFGVRRATQQISNITKYVYADEVDLLVKGGKKELEILGIINDDRVAEQIKKINIILANLQGDIMALGTESGSSPTDGSLAFFGNNAKSHLPDTASKEEVIAAVKRVAPMLKKCTEISQQLLRFGEFLK
jgi:hypothetical protein